MGLQNWAIFKTWRWRSIYLSAVDFILFFIFSWLVQTSGFSVVISKTRNRKSGNKEFENREFKKSSIVQGDTKCEVTQSAKWHQVLDIRYLLDTKNYDVSIPFFTDVAPKLANLWQTSKVHEIDPRFAKKTSDWFVKWSIANQIPGSRQWLHLCRKDSSMTRYLHVPANVIMQNSSSGFWPRVWPFRRRKPNDYEFRHMALPNNAKFGAKMRSDVVVV